MRVGSSLGTIAGRVNPVVVTVVAIAIVATFFRDFGIPKWHTMWAEDGSVFVACAWHQSLPACFATPYQGYIHLVPRIAAAIVVLLNPRDLPFGLTLISALVAGAGAALAGRAVGEVTRSRIAGVLAGAGFVLVWQAGREISGEVANLHLVLFGASAAVLICQWLGRRCRPADWILIGVTGVTTAFSPALPVIALIGVAARTERSRTTFAVTTAAALPQVIVELTNRRIDLGHAISIQSMVSEFWRLVVRQGFFGPRHPLWGEALVLLLVALIVWFGISYLVRRSAGTADHDARMALWACAATAATAALAFASWVVSVEVNGTIGPRYAYEPAALLIVAVAIGVGSAAFLARPGDADAARDAGRAASRARGLLVAGLPLLLTVAIGVGFATSFRLEARTSPGPDVAAAIAAFEMAPVKSCSGSVDVPFHISPIDRPWFVPVPCDRLSP